MASNPGEPSLPPGYSFAVAPVTVTPDQGAFPGHGKPFFREASLAVTRAGLVTVFTEAAPGTGNGPTWSCASRTGRSWSCHPVDTGPSYVGQVDPWVTSTAGDPCPRYHGAVTLVESRENNIETFTSTDLGQTWQGPDVVVAGTYDDDGEKVLFTGRTFVAYRSFYGAGQWVSRLGTATDPCAWTPPVPVTPTALVQNGDHPRLAATEQPDAVAVRGSAVGTTAGGVVLNFNRVNPDLTVAPQDVTIGVSTEPTVVQASCGGTGSCASATDAGATLLYDPVRRRYFTVFTDAAAPTEGLPTDLVTRLSESTDGGRTWSPPVAVAGSGVAGSPAGASSMQPNLAWDPVLGTAVLGYYERPARDSTVVRLRLRVLRPEGQWGAPVTIDETPYDPQQRPGVSVLAGFGDYTALQACGGVAHMVYEKLGPGPTEAEAQAGQLPPQLTGYLSYAAVRFAPAPLRHQKCPV
jgi:hypothetical protein